MTTATVDAPATGAITTDFLSIILAHPGGEPNQVLPPVGEGEVVLGVIGEQTRKVFILIESYGGTIARLEETVNARVRQHFLDHLEPDYPSEMCTSFAKEMEGLLSDLDLNQKMLKDLQAIFWSLVHMAIPESINPEMIAIREGWQLVKVPEKTHHATTAGFEGFEVISIDELFGARPGSTMSARSSLGSILGILSGLGGRLGRRPRS